MVENSLKKWIVQFHFKKGFERMCSICKKNTQKCCFGTNDLKDNIFCCIVSRPITFNYALKYQFSQSEKNVDQIVSVSENWV